MPRKPAPWPGELIAMQWGRSKFSSFSPSSYEQTEAKLGCTTVGLGAYPVCIMYVPRSWFPSFESSDRMMLRCCICLATLGRCSLISTPPAEVAIGLNGPPFFSLSGLRSQVSMWLGPPDIQSRMQLLFVLRSRWALASIAPKNCMAGTARVVVAMWPRKWRRDIPWGTSRRSGMGRKPPFASRARRFRGAATWPSPLIPGGIIGSRRTRWS